MLHIALLPIPARLHIALLPIPARLYIASSPPELMDSNL